MVTHQTQQDGQKSGQKHLLSCLAPSAKDVMAAVPKSATKETNFVDTDFTCRHACDAHQTPPVAVRRVAGPDRASVVSSEVLVLPMAAIPPRREEPAAAERPFPEVLSR